MSQVDMLLDMLKEGPVTAMDCIDEGIINYRGRIADLRALGFQIKTDFKESVNRRGKESRYALYTLESEVPMPA